MNWGTNTKQTNHLIYLHHQHLVPPTKTTITYRKANGNIVNILKKITTNIITQDEEMNYISKKHTKKTERLTCIKHWKRYAMGHPPHHWQNHHKIWEITCRVCVKSYLNEGNVLRIGIINRRLGSNKPRDNTIHWISHDEIKTTPQDRTVTYARIVVNYRPQKVDPSRVCITFGSNLITNPGELTTHTAKMTFTKVLWSAQRMPSTCLLVLKKFTWKHLWTDTNTRGLGYI